MKLGRPIEIVSWCAPDENRQFENERKREKEKKEKI